jgi:hypothetical protein|tara:strand:+ start:9517 stop:10278 length:762 start_codon:yes stop_codon:yes gene_type:complete
MEKTMLFILFFFTVLSHSQEQKALFGTIMDSLNVINNVHIVNLNSKQGTISADDGSFKIFAKVGDTLALSSIQYQKKKYRVQNNSFSFQGLNLYLISKVYLLKEIQVKRHDLLGSLGIDINAVPTPIIPTMNAVALTLPNAGRKKMKKVDREIYTAKNTHIDYLLNILSGRLTKLRKKKKLREEAADVNIMFDSFKLTLERHFNINKEVRFAFLNFCITDPLFNKKLVTDELALIAFLQLKSIEFNALNTVNK